MTTENSRADALTEKQRHAVDEAAKVLRDNWEHGTAEDLLMAFLPASPASQPAPSPPDERAALSKDVIREVFMAHGFTIKEGQSDLKQYVYDAADALLARAASANETKDKT